MAQVNSHGDLTKCGPHADIYEVVDFLDIDAFCLTSSRVACRNEEMLIFLMRPDGMKQLVWLLENKTLVVPDRGMHISFHSHTTGTSPSYRRTFHRKRRVVLHPACPAPCDSVLALCAPTLKDN